MEFINHLRPSIWDVFMSKYFASHSIVASDTGDFTFPPSAEFIRELKDSFTMAKIEKHKSGPAFSAYHVTYHIGGQKGDAFYKATTATYPNFDMYDTEEEYEMSFSLND